MTLEQFTNLKVEQKMEVLNKMFKEVVNDNPLSELFNK